MQDVLRIMMKAAVSLTNPKDIKCWSTYYSCMDSLI